MRVIINLNKKGKIMEDGKLSGLVVFLLGALVAANWSKIRGWLPFVGERPKS